MKTKTKFDWKQFLKALAVIGIPVALQNLLTTTGSMVDTMMVARLGEQNVAAIGLCAQFSSLLFACIWGFVGGGMLFMSQYWGARDEDGIDRSYGMTLMCMLFMSAIFFALGFFFPHFVMSVYTDKEALRLIGVDYLRIVAFQYPLMVTALAISSLLRSTERVRIPLYASIVSVAVNIFLNWVLIFGHFGFAPLGVRGAAIATVSAQLCNLLVVVLCAAFTKYPFLFQFKKHFKWTKESFGLFLKKSFPIICNEFLIGVGGMIINIVLGHQEESAIAAVAVFRTFEGLIIGFFAGFSNAASILVGKSVGAGELNIAFARAKRLVYVCQATIATVIVLVNAFHTPLLHLMSLKGAAFDYCSAMLVIFGIFVIIRMGNWIQNDTYRSAGDSVTGTVLEIAFMFAMVVPCLLIANYVFKAPFLVVFTMCYVDEPIRYIIMQKHMYSGKWIRPVTEEGKAALAELNIKKAQ